MTGETLQHLIHLVTRTVEVAGIAVILVGAALSFWRYALALRGAGRGDAYRGLRCNLGRSILLGLELLVAADIVNTVAIELTLDSLALLAGVVLVRTFLSFSLEVEIEGCWPWQRRAREERGRG